MTKGIYHGICPSCGGPISSERLQMGLPCSTCLPSAKVADLSSLSELPPSVKFKTISRMLSGSKVSSAYHLISSIYSELDNFGLFFKERVGKEMWSLQRTWGKRLLEGESFAITAPTGVGKTTLLLIYAAYQLMSGKKVYVLVPTDSLLNQTSEKLSAYLKNTNKNFRIIAYTSKATKKSREEILRRISSGDYDVLITTTSFLSRRFELLKGKKFDLIIVDDADSLLKNSSNIDRVLLLLGFDEKDIEMAQKIIKLKGEIAFYINSNNNDKFESIKKQLEELQASLENSKAEKTVGQLCIASATGRQSGSKPKLFKELLNFEIGGIHDYMRNVIDSYYIYSGEEELLSILHETIKRLGKGGLIFISRDLKKEVAKKIVSYLQAKGIRALIALSGKRVIDKLESGEADVLVGMSSYYGVIVRGIDLPLTIRYAIFIGVPKNRIPVDIALFNPRRLMQVLAYLTEKNQSNLDEFSDLLTNLNKLSPSEQTVLRIAFNKRNISELNGRLKDIANEVLRAISFATRALQEAIGKSPGSVLSLGTAVIERGEDGELYFVAPDPLTYIQASGRTSRYLNDRMTLGFSLILEKNMELLEAFKKRISSYVTSFELKDFRDLNLNDITRMIDDSRKGIGSYRTFKPAKSLMLVVESPNKAKTIASYFGRASKRRFGSIVVYEIPIVDQKTMETYLAMIIATKGHIFDLVSEPNIGVHGVLKINGEVIPVYVPIQKCLSCGRSFTSLSRKCPYCGENLKIRSSEEVIQVLRKIAMESEHVIIATDPDTEGEKIAWDVFLALKPYNNNIKRAEFHEITKEAVLEAIRSTRDISKSKVNSQILRRITDRWIGFPLSLKLWEKYSKPWLGAGRVQTPVLGWIIRRHNEWKNAQGYWIKTLLPGSYPLYVFKKDKNAAESLLQYLKEKKAVALKKAITYEEELNPPPPYTTDELLYDANKVLGIGASYAMKVLQDLFESGLITYHRTDSTHISSKGIQIAKEYLYEIVRRPELFVGRSWGNEGAHEAIRPTKPLSYADLKKSIYDGTVRTTKMLTEVHMRVYDLIFRRFISSQSRASRILKAELTFSINGEDVVREVPIKEVSLGFASILGARLYPEIEPYLKQGSVPIESEKTLIFKGSQVSLYTQGEIIKLMKERGIGRPSTYAKTLESLRRHGYIVISKKRNYVISTKIAQEVYEYLTSMYSALVGEEVTSVLEQKMDEVENGKADHIKLLESLYNSLIELRLLTPEQENVYVPSSILDEATA